MSQLSGLFGPSINGLSDNDFVLIGEMEENVVARLKTCCEKPLRRAAAESRLSSGLSLMPMLMLTSAEFWHSRPTGYDVDLCWLSAGSKSLNDTLLQLVKS